jgi:toxin CcdB
MAQFDVYESASGGGYLLDVQSDIMRDLGTRIVVPLMPARRVPPPLRRLHPQFTINGHPTVLATHLMAAVPSAELRRRVGNLGGERYSILGAIDFLLTGA